MNDPHATPARFALAFTILTTMRGMPQIYASDEIAMQGGEDPDNRRDFPAFTEQQRTPEQQGAFSIVQSLLMLRRQHPALQGGEEQVIDAGKDTLVYVRSVGSEHILVAVNKGATAKDLTLVTDDTVLFGRKQATSLWSTPQQGTSQPGTSQRGTSQQIDSRAIRLDPHHLNLHLEPEQARTFNLK